jgi:hypothetical protein
MPEWVAGEWLRRRTLLISCEIDLNLLRKYQGQRLFRLHQAKPRHYNEFRSALSERTDESACESMTTTLSSSKWIQP